MKKTSWLLLITIFALALLAAYNGTLEQNGARTAIRFLALGGFFLLCLSLIMGPLAVLWPKMFIELIESRRAVGIGAFIFLSLHFILAFSLYFGWNFGFVTSDFALVLATPGMLILFALTITSCDWAIQKLGMKNWKRVQYFIYLLFAISFAHFLLKASGPAFLPAPFPAWNLAEATMVLLGIMAIILQIAGFLERQKRASSG